jgi:plasmid maintenance system antidote protein VapI
MLNSSPKVIHRNKPCEPNDKNSFGYVLWSILGGKDTSIGEAAEHLHIHRVRLSAIIHGRENISQKALINKQWRETLAQHYPEAWHRHKAAFEQYANTLTIRSISKTHEPDDKNSFGYVLWSILGGKDAHMGEAAERLQIHRSNLSTIIHGKWRRVLPKTLAERKWRETLAQHYPEAWQRHQAAFEQYADASTKRSVSKTRESSITREPDDKNSFGYVLWNILGGKDANMREAAMRLQIHRVSLSAIIHGRKRISQKALINKQWRETLAQHYPEAWHRHKATFEQHANTLTKRSISKIREPDDKNSFGYVLWSILGGKDASMGEAAERLQIDNANLSKIIDGKWRRVLPKTLAKRKWRETLAQYYPEAWQKYKVAFEERAINGGKTNTLNGDWRKAVGKFVTRVLGETGDEYKDIVGDVQTPSLKEVEMWKRIVSGDQDLNPGLFKDALVEICSLYKLEADIPEAGIPNNRYSEAQLLIAKHG